MTVVLELCETVWCFGLKAIPSDVEIKRGMVARITVKRQGVADCFTEPRDIRSSA